MIGKTVQRHPPLARAAGGEAGEVGVEGVESLNFSAAPAEHGMRSRVLDTGPRWPVQKQGYKSAASATAANTVFAI